MPWNGTHAVDELSLASPIDSGLCGRAHINALSALPSSVNKPKIIAYIASDSPESAAQISATLAHPHTVIAPPGCHIDFDPSAQCSRDTLLHWFALTLSDVSVLQSFVDTESGRELAASSFSRYAMIYGLRGADSLVYASQSCGKQTGQSGVISGERSGRTTTDINHTRWDNAVSRTAQGNWVCTGGDTIY